MLPNSKKNTHLTSKSPHKTYGQFFKPKPRPMNHKAKDYDSKSTTVSSQNLTTGGIGFNHRTNPIQRLQALLKSSNSRLNAVKRRELHHLLDKIV
jgi:hypothetical protein